MPHTHKVIIPDGAYGFYSWLVPLLGAYAFAQASPIIGSTETEGIIVWFGIYFFWGFRIIPQTDYLVVERFGTFNRIVHSGPRILCFPGLIDKIADRGTLRWRELALFADDKEPYRVDFKDGSTPVVMKASWRIGPQGNTLAELDRAIYLFTYTMRSDGEREERIEEVLESAAIPQLQQYEISQALVEKDAVAEKVTGDSGVLDALMAIGIELNPQKGLIIPDIALTPEIIEQRQKKLQGASEAEKQKAQGLGYARSIKGIMEELEVSQGEARQIYETQRGLETLAQVDANVSFVAPDIRGIQRTMGIGDANPRRDHQSKRRTA